MIFLTDLRQDTIELIRGMEDTHIGRKLEDLHYRYSEWIRYACEHLVHEADREEMAVLLSPRDSKRSFSGIRRTASAAMCVRILRGMSISKFGRCFPSRMKIISRSS